MHHLTNRRHLAKPIAEALIHLRGQLILSACLLACLSPSTARAGQPRHIELTWQQLRSTILNERVHLLLPPGIEIRGRVKDIQPDALVINIKKSSDRKVYPKGRTLIPRSSVSTLHWKRHGKLWRIVGTSTGAVLGTAMAGAIVLTGGGLCLSNHCDSNAGTGAGALAALGGMTAGGYYLGKAGDRTLTTITIIDHQAHPQRDEAPGAGPGTPPAQ